MFNMAKTKMGFKFCFNTKVINTDRVAIAVDCVAFFQTQQFSRESVCSTNEQTAWFFLHKLNLYRNDLRFVVFEQFSVSSETLCCSKYVDYIFHFLGIFLTKISESFLKLSCLFSSFFYIFTWADNIWDKKLLKPTQRTISQLVIAATFVECRKFVHSSQSKIKKTLIGSCAWMNSSCFCIEKWFKIFDYNRNLTVKI